MKVRNGETGAHSVSSNEMWQLILAVEDQTLVLPLLKLGLSEMSFGGLLTEKRKGLKVFGFILGPSVCPG